jgi:anti-sigma factor RsiW
MTCREAQSLVHAYVDRELDVVRTLEFERHLADCTECAQRIRAIRSLSARIKDLYLNPSESFQAAMLSKFRAPAPPKPRTFPMPRLLAIAASFIVLVTAAYFATRFVTAPSGNELLAAEVVSSHVRSLMANHLTDVPSTDQHTVKPWFAGRLDYSPVVKDLSSEGFNLIGGRLDYLDGRPVAALVFKTRQHYINLFCWPAENRPDSKIRQETRQGYNLVTWTRSQVIYWAVSDLNSEELMTFVHHYGD